MFSIAYCWVWYRTLLGSSRLHLKKIHLLACFIEQIKDYASALCKNLSILGDTISQIRPILEALYPLTAM